MLTAAACAASSRCTWSEADVMSLDMWTPVKITNSSITPEVFGGPQELSAAPLLPGPPYQASADVLPAGGLVCVGRTHEWEATGCAFRQVRLL